MITVYYDSRHRCRSDSGIEVAKIQMPRPHRGHSKPIFVDGWEGHAKDAVRIDIDKNIWLSWDRFGNL
jgi:hypothetical protein